MNCKISYFYDQAMIFTRVESSELFTFDSILGGYFLGSDRNRNFIFPSLTRAS